MPLGFGEPVKLKSKRYTGVFEIVCFCGISPRKGPWLKLL
jgi:hypothetical protein